MKQNKITLKEQYELICNNYIEQFAKKQELESYYWVSSQIGGIVCFINEYYFNFNDITYDINTNQPKDLILQWQNDSVDNPDKTINYYAYSLGLRHKDLK